MIMNKLAQAFIILMSSLLWMPLTAHSEGLSDLFGNSSGSAQSKFLPVDKAFQVSASTSTQQDKATLSIQFNITPGHYVYKDRIKLNLPAGVSAGALKFNQPSHFVDDPEFGRVAVFDQPSLVVTALLNNTGAESVDKGAITISWQGCAKAGLCYPPERVNTTVSLSAASKVTSTPADKAKGSINKADTQAGGKADQATSQGIDNTATNKKTAANPANNLADNAKARDNTTVANNAVANAITNSAGQSNSDPAALENSKALGNESIVGTGDEADQSVLFDENGQVIDADQSAIYQGNEADSLTADRLANDDTSAASGAEASSHDSKPLVDQDPFKLATHPWLALGLLFLAGLGLAFTPCVLPMLPIVANIVGNQRDPTAKKSVILTSSYALGVAIAYGLLGALIAVFGQSLGIIGWLQNPAILLSFAAIFVILALYMLDLVPIRVPAFISRKMGALNEAGNSKLGSTGGSLIAGFLSALVVSPCVSAPLFGALLAVSTIGNPLLGFAALFMLGFGLSAPLIILGATQGSFMPKAGMWMNWVKQGFALLLFAVALLLIERVFVSAWMLMVWALWFMVVAVWAWQWRERGRIFTQALGLVAGIWAATLIIGAALGNTDSLQPLASLNSTSKLQAVATNNNNSAPNNLSAQPSSAKSATLKITTLAELDQITANSPKVLVDVTAEWCIECRIMDKALFANPPAQLADWQVVKLDITDTTPESKAIFERYRLFGPPALLYYQDSKLVAQQVGETKRADFVDMLTRLQ